MSVQGFKGEYRWLSNFWPAQVMLNGINFPTVEHAYQAAKSDQPAKWAHFATLPKPSDAKRAGARLKLRADWDSIKLSIMEGLVRQKFNDPDLRQKLFDTGAQLLEETNHWGDTFWGICNNEGNNHLGKILMRVREELRGVARNYKSRKRLLLAIDFDGTIVTHSWPGIGEPLPYAFEVMHKLQAAGHQLILVTCREDEPRRKYLTEAVEFCAQRGIEFRSVNENHRDDDFRDHGGRKVFAHFYIDDRNLGGFPGWLEVERLLLHDGEDPQLEKLALIAKEIQNVDYSGQDKVFAGKVG